MTQYHMPVRVTQPEIIRRRRVSFEDTEAAQTPIEKAWSALRELQAIEEAMKGADVNIARAEAELQKTEEARRLAAASHEEVKAGYWPAANAHKEAAQHTAHEWLRAEEERIDHNTRVEELHEEVLRAPDLDEFRLGVVGPRQEPCRRPLYRRRKRRKPTRAAPEEDWRDFAATLGPQPEPPQSPVSIAPPTWRPLRLDEVAAAEQTSVREVTCPPEALSAPTVAAVSDVTTMQSIVESLPAFQLELNEACEDLLASRTWNSTQALTYSGLIQRLEMITEAGLPPVRVLSAAKLESLGRIPRSDEGHQEEAIAAVRRCGPDVYDHPKAVLLFYSHCWLRPDWCEESRIEVERGSADREAAEAEGARFGDPDNAQRSKARALAQYARWFKRELGKSNDGAFGSRLADLSTAADLEIFFWIDFACAEQDAPGPDMAALPASVAVCSMIVASWSSVYTSRAWCRAELLLAYAFAPNGDKVLALPEGFVDQEQPRVVVEKMEIADPADGEITCPRDMAMIVELRGVAARSSTFSCWRACVNNSTESAFMCLVWNVFCCCQWCGFLALGNTRTVKPGDSEVDLLTPLPERLSREEPPASP